MALTIGVAGRALSGAGAAVSLQVVPISTDLFSAAFELGVHPSRTLTQAEEYAGREPLWRAWWDVDAALVGAIEPNEAIRVEAIGGVAHRTFTQQFTPIREVLVPYVGLGAEASAGGRVRLGLRARATTDLRTVTLVNSIGEAEAMVPVQFGVDLVLRLGSRGDVLPQ
jgi:hypothetical protein